MQFWERKAPYCNCNRGMHAYFSTGAQLGRPYAQAWLAEAVAEKGAVDQAITIIEQTLAFTKRSRETYFDSELVRLKATFLLRLGKDHFAQSLDMAIALGAHLLRLRTATGYAQHLLNSGRRQMAKTILEEALHARNFSENQVDVVAANSMIKIAL